MRPTIRSIARLAILALPLLCGMFPRSTVAQNVPATATGKTYLIAFPKPLENLFDVRFPNLLQDKVKLLVYANQSTPVSVTTSAGAAVATMNLSAGAVQEIDLPITPSLYVDQGGIVTDHVLYVRARHPILLYCSITNKFGTEAWTPLPIESWGEEYYSAALPAETVQDVTPYSEFNYTAEAKGAPSQIIIIAARNNTNVTVYPNSNVGGGSGTNPLSIHLDAGEAYMVVSQTPVDGSGSHDLGGTRIVSNKIIGVISGNTRSSAGNDDVTISGNSYKNMMIEALAPVEEHGTEFVFMPTWDAQRLLSSDQGIPLEGKRLSEYLRVYGSASGTTYGTVTDNQGNLQVFNVAQSAVHNESFSGLQQAHVVRTDQPTEVMMHPAAVVKFNGTTVYGQNYIGADYQGWSPYMVELTPREQWTTVAPFMAPSYPSSMNSFVNVAARAQDAQNISITVGNGPSQQFLFNHGTIPGTDLVWGSMSIVQGLSYRLQGTNGARFAGFVYGTRSGSESYRPGGTKKDEKGSSVQSAHPSEYEEVLGISYGYPLAPRRRILNDPDEYSIRIDNSGGENEQVLKITASTANPVGIRSIDMAMESINTDFEILDFADQENEAELIGKSSVTVRVHPIDPTQDASGTLVITDRTGNETSVPYEYQASISGVDEHGSIVSQVKVVGSNPTVGQAGILLTLSRSGDVRTTITNALGQQIAIVADGRMNAGEHLLQWNASGVPAGIYFCTVTSEGGTTVRRIVLQ